MFNKKNDLKLLNKLLKICVKLCNDNDIQFHSCFKDNNKVSEFMSNSTTNKLDLFSEIFAQDIIDIKVAASETDSTRVLKYIVEDMEKTTFNLINSKFKELPILKFDIDDDSEDIKSC